MAFILANKISHEFSGLKMSVSNASILSLESLKAIPFILKTSLQDNDLLLLPSVRVGNVIWWYLTLTLT